MSIPEKYNFLSLLGGICNKQESRAMDKLERKVIYDYLKHLLVTASMLLSMLYDVIIEDGLDRHMVGTSRAYPKTSVVIVEKSHLPLQCLLFLTLKIIL